LPARLVLNSEAGFSPSGSPHLILISLGPSSAPGAPANDLPSMRRAPP
jgi:hypothetical protein